MIANEKHAHGPDGLILHFGHHSPRFKPPDPLGKNGMSTLDRPFRRQDIPGHKKTPNQIAFCDSGVLQFRNFTQQLPFGTTKHPMIYMAFMTNLMLANASF